jgi:2Fe-2S ferredoxin
MEPKFYIKRTSFSSEIWSNRSMPQVTYVDHDGARHSVEVPVGENVMRGALYNGIEGIVGECGGGLACATCHCYVDEAWAAKLEAPSEAELQMLESAACEVKPNSRLSCQIAMTEALDGIVVDLPEKQY